MLWSLLPLLLAPLLAYLILRSRNSMEVIEISSSPEPDPKPIPRKAGPSKTRKNRQRGCPRPALFDGDVIEISDSEDEGKRPSGSNKQENSSQAEPGPSRVSPTSFVSSRDSAPTAGLSARSQLAQKVAARQPSPQKSKAQDLPLFLPSDEEPPEPQENAFGINSGAALDVPPDPLALRKSPSPVVDRNPIDTYLARVLEIIPDVQPAHALSLLEQNLPTYNEGVVEAVLHILFENPSYPKLDKKGKRKRVENDGGDGDQRGVPKVKLDYGSKDRPFKGGHQYVDLAMEQLGIDFPYVPKSHIRKKFLVHKSLYAPTYLFLAEEKKKGKVPYKLKAVSSRTTGKGKGKEKQDDEFDQEREWLLLKLQEDAAKHDAMVAEELNEKECGECGDGIECGCCFSSYPFDKMIQCPDAHLFCNDCMTSYASNLLGGHDHRIVCMDQSGCKLAFPESELRRFLTSKLMDLYDRVKQRKEIEAAGLEGLEECPFCEYKVVIENPDEKLFRCENAECGSVTCRQCKKADHLPKSCKEMEEDKHLDARHVIEEAMTKALMRNCPKCNKAFIKENGCNKMTCPNCRTLSCYVCRQIVTGYDHFGNPPPYTGQPNPNKCSLWDPVEQRHANEVTEAAKKALEDYKREHPEVDERDIHVDLPPPPPVAGPAHAAGHAMPFLGPPPVHQNRVMWDPFDGGLPAAGLHQAHVQEQLRQRAVAAMMNFNINVNPPPPHIHGRVAIPEPIRRQPVRRR